MLTAELVLLEQRRNLTVQSVETGTGHLASVMPDTSYPHQVRNDEMQIKGQL